MGVESGCGIVEDGSIGHFRIAASSGLGGSDPRTGRAGTKRFI